MDAAELRRYIQLLCGEIDSLWEIDTILANDDEDGIILLRFAPGTSPKVIHALHKLMAAEAKRRIAE